MHIVRTTALLGLTAALFCPTAIAQVQVSPRDRDVLEGSASTSYPLGRADSRVQTLHADLGPGPRRLAGHAYRRDAINTRGALAGFKVEMSVTVSVSPRTPETASATFVENVGNSTAVVVLPRTWVTFAPTQRPGAAPASDFEYWIPWTSTFTYPGNDQTICVDVTVYGNDGPNGINANFTAYTDAHEQFKDGRALQPGFRTGNGCGAIGASTAAYANLEFRNLPAGMELDIQSRYGMPSDPTGEGYSALLFTYQLQGISWSVRPSCMLYTNPNLVLLLPGANSDKGHWNGQVNGFRLPIGTTFYTQVVSVHMLNGFALSDTSELVVPPIGPMPVQVVRVANGSDATAISGSISNSVPVIEFF